MKKRLFVSALAQFILKNRLILFLVFFGFTVFCGFSLKNINTNPGFEKTLPIEHPYIKTFFDYREIFGNANRVIISYKPAVGTIYNAESLDVLKNLTEDLFYLKGIERSSLTSLFTPNVRYMEIVEDGFKGGNVISANFSGTDKEIDTIRKNVISLLDWCKEKDIICAVCTNKREDLAIKLLKEINLYKYFDYVAGADTFDYRKPDPRHLTDILKILDIEELI